MPVPAPVTVAQPVAASESMPLPMPASLNPAAQLQSAGQGPEAAAGMLVLAQKLHDEYVRNGEQQRDRIVGDAREHAARLVREAEEKQRQTLGSLEQERSLLERKIDELRAFEREYRSRLKSYLEGQLRDLEAKAAVVPGRSQAPAPAPAPAPASVGVGGQQSYNSGPLPTRGAYAASFDMGGAILAAAGLSFIGFGTQPPTAEWGVMISEGRNYIATHAWLSLFPGLAILLTVAAFNLIGDGLRDALDPRLRGTE
jgi:vacuolar-type H+-ATPase subunit H